MLSIENRYNDEKLYVKSRDMRKHILWEFESHCNMKCKYCYDSRTRNIQISEQTVKSLVEKINSSDIEYIHITGGEPTLNPYMEYVVKSLKNKKICITTNLVSFPAHLRSEFFNTNVHSVAVSLDSIDEKENDFLRGNTKDVLRNIQELLSCREQVSSKTKIRIHSVISKININSLGTLLEWAQAQHIDEVSCQPISLSPNHPYHNALSVTVDDLDKILEILRKESILFNAQYADSHSKLLEYYLGTSDCYTMNGRQLCYPYIDASGVIWNCPRKLHVIEDSFRDISDNTECCVITPQCMCCLKRHRFASAP